MEKSDGGVERVYTGEAGEEEDPPVHPVVTGPDHLPPVEIVEDEHVRSDIQTVVDGWTD